MAFDCDMGECLSTTFFLGGFPFGGSLGRDQCSAVHMLGRSPFEFDSGNCKTSTETAVLDDSADEVGRPIDCLLGSPFSRNIMAKIKRILQHNLNGAALSVGAAWEAVREDAEIAVNTFHEKKIYDGPFAFSKHEKLAEKRWDRFCLLSRVAHYGTLECDHLPLLPALANCRYMMYQKTRTWEVAPALPLQLAIKLFSAQLQQIDSNGDTLLHLACRGGKPERHREPWDDGPDDDESDDGSFFVTKTYDNWDLYNHGQINCLLSVNPEAAKVRNGNGDLPIHVAIKARKCWSNIIYKFSSPIRKQLRRPMETVTLVSTLPRWFVLL